MTRRCFDVLKLSVLAIALLNLTWSVGCGDGAAVEPEVTVEEGGADDPLNLSSGKGGAPAVSTELPPEAAEPAE